MNIINEDSGLRGDVHWQLIGAEGQVKLEGGKQNLIVTAGNQFVAAALSTASLSPFTNIALGTSVTPPALGDTALGAELSRAVAAVNTVGTVTTFVASWAAGIATGALTEAGIFNNTVGGVMLSHVTFSAINKSVTDTLTITWNITVG